MSDCNCCFIIETGVFVEWMTPTGKTYYINDFENRGDCNSLFQRKTVPLKKVWVASSNDDGTTHIYGYKCCFAITICLKKIKGVKYIVYTPFMTAMALLKWIQNPLRSGTTFVKKDTLYSLCTTH